MRKKKPKRTRSPRLTAADRAIAEANRLAGLLADAPSENNDPLAPPAFIADPRLAPALQVWKDHAPRLHDLGLFNSLDRRTFAMLCVYVAEFVAANEDILAHGYSIMVPTVAGGAKGAMPRLNPSVARRDTAMDYILDFSRRFGLTPMDRFGLMRLSKNPNSAPLFDQAPAVPSPATADEADAEAEEWRRLTDPSAPPRPN